MACVQAPKRRVQERRGKREGTLVSKASRAALHTDSGSLRRNTLLDAHDPMNSNPQVQQPRGPKLKFCPESNDLLYPKEDRERRVLVFHCKSCDYTEDADPSDWCVYRNEVHHTSKERTVILQDVRADPTLPRTRDVRCPTCGHDEAVFFSASTEEGMTLFFNCTGCGHRWRDYV